MDLFLASIREVKCFYLTKHSSRCIYDYMASDTPAIRRVKTRCRHYSFRLAARVLLYAPSHSQDSKYYGLCYTSSGALAGTINNSMGPPREFDPTTHRTTSGRSTVKLRPAHLMLMERKEVVYLTTHSTHFIYGYMAREETRCRQMGYKGYFICIIPQTG